MTHKVSRIVFWVKVANIAIEVATVLFVFVMTLLGLAALDGAL